MTSKWFWLMALATRKLWLQAVLFAFVSVVAALAGLAVAQFLPEVFGQRIGAQAVDEILTILASSMLAVTTFSLSVMVQAYSAASASVTPRATQLLIEDRTTHTVLATFLGAFIFALVGLIALKSGLYDESGQVGLFAVTLAVVAAVVMTVMRWIEHLTHFGRVRETTEAVEAAAARAMKERRGATFLGGHALTDPGRVPKGARPILATQTGYVQHVDSAALSACAEAFGGEVYLEAQPGTFVHPARPLVRVSGFEDPEAASARVRAAFTVADRRSFDNDPRFGLCVLTEIASRALSPGVNDPGTAIDVIGRVLRLLALWAEPQPAEEVRYPRLWVPPLKPDDLLDDSLAPIARDGAALIEIQIRVQKALLALAQMAPGVFGEAAATEARRALELAVAALVLDSEKELVAGLAGEVAKAAREA
ncbi:DUF2254 domain-containing protein [Ostreiculturibacter nitratireducens]|uniref:DUF2254 domain-containing protein n=1 Tax=Ostreiculturibacter nitratireducens TaxID=3075226 RepID=UPI0031B5B0B1